MLPPGIEPVSNDELTSDQDGTTPKVAQPPATETDKETPIKTEATTPTDSEAGKNKNLMLFLLSKLMKLLLDKALEMACVLNF